MVYNNKKKHMVEDDFVASKVEVPYQNFEGHNKILDESNSIIVEDRQEEPFDEAYAVDEQIETIEEENSQSRLVKAIILFSYLLGIECV